MKEEVISERALKKKTLVAFGLFLAAICAAAILWITLRNEPKQQGIEPLLRKGHLANEQLFAGSFPEGRLVPTCAKSAAL